MRLFRSALALSIALSLVLLSPGSSAWAQVAEAVHGASPVSGAGSAAAAGAVPGSAAAAPLTAAPVLALGAFAGVSAAPSAILPGAPASLSAAVLPAAAPASLPVVQALSPAVRAAASLTAPARTPASATAAAGKAAAPAATAIEGARRELPEFSKMSEGDSKGAASADFLARVGEFFRPAPAPALSAALVPASDGVSEGSPAPLSRYRASPSNSPSAPAVESASVAAPSARSAAVPLFAAAATLGLSALAGVSLVSTIATLPLVLVSLVLHEIGHGKAAAWLGDPTATREGRASFNPLTWGRHVDPVMTLVLPLVTYVTSGFIFGGAKPVPIDSSYFKNPTRDMAKVALAGPAVNIALAALGALAYAGAVAGGLGAVALGALTSFIFINVLLAVFNLMPILPLDGGHVLLAALPHKAADGLRGFYARIGLLGMIPIAAIALLGGGVIMGAAAALTHLLIGASFALTGVQLAGAALPAMAALGMAIGSLRETPGVARLMAASGVPAAPVIPGAASGDSERPVDLVVVFSNEKSIAKDLQLTSVDSRSSNYVQAYEGVQRSLLAQLNSVGLSPDALSTYNATPVASYARINAATIRVDAAKAAEFEAALRALGHQVYPNERRRIITPIPMKPEAAGVSSRGAVTMTENLSITHADAVQQIVEKRWGKPDLNPWQRLLRALGAAAAPQPKIAVVDTGADVTHPLLRRVQEVKNMTSGKNGDGNGHGSWVTSMVLNYAPWLKNLVHYKTFTDDGGASLDDILKSLTAAANDGSLVISNSWGSDEGDPESPDSLLVKKLASEGHILVFAAGNAGPGANTIGSPAIVQFKDPATGAIRVVAVAATDRDKLVTDFSSRGPGTQKTAGKDGFAHRPDLAAVGLNTEGAWPAALGDADRTDPELGSLKAISGTSMSTPSVAGAIALLLIAFGITEKGAKLDAVINAVMATLAKTGKNSPDEEGGGFINVEAAYELLYKQFNPGEIPPTAILRYQRLLSDQKSMSDYLDPLSEANRVAGQPDDRIVRSMLGDMKSVEERLNALTAQYPGIRRAAAGPAARAWARLTGRAPVPAYVGEYRRFAERVEREDESRRAFLRDVQNQAAGVREEMLEYYYGTMERESAESYSALAALLKAHPDAPYRAAGLLGRAWLRLTGRGPQS